MIWHSFIAGIFIVLYSIYFLFYNKKTKKYAVLCAVLYFITGCFAIIMSYKNFLLPIRKLSACISIIAFLSVFIIDKINKSN